MISNILLVDDEPIEASVLGEILRDKGFDVTIRTDPLKALELAQRESFELVISDLKMPSMDGVELLQKLRVIDPELTVIIMTAHATVSTAVTAMKEGAFDYITKPFSKDELLISVNRAIKNLQILRENAYLKGKLGFGPDPTRIIGNSPKMRQVYDLAVKLAEDDKATILIQGETGTGKDLLARAIHQMSPRKNEPFIIINCAAIPETLMESELFGHEKGAFTGAVHAKPGRFELADRGTLFLDEVTEMNAGMQGKLLRVLQTREFERVGGTRTQRVNVRVIAATNRNLGAEVRAGRFREDLFYRLNVVPIFLPPLRDRKEDIPQLVEYFLRRLSAEGKRSTRISPDAVDALQKYDYPGNVRELENIIERAIILSDGKWITPRELYWLPLADSASPAIASDLKGVGSQAREDAERALLLDTLRTTAWNRLKAAKALGVDYKTLRRKIRQYRLVPGGDRTP
jgi:DNA-binding NtrC family response regulator